MNRFPLAQIVLLAVSILSGGRQAGAQAGPGQPLLRVERVRLGEATCVLVNETGAYRLEKLYRAKSELYVGTVSQPQLEQLKTYLADLRLQKLAQDDIRHGLISDSLDELQFAIRRARGWQELMFFDTKSRSPHRAYVDPVVHWFEDIQKQRPAAVRVQGDPTRCTPPANAQLIVTTSADDAANARPQVPPGSPYLFRLHSQHFYQHAESECIIVFPDGAYHREKSIQEMGAKLRDRVTDGHVSTETLEALRVILDNADLSNAPDTSWPQDRKPSREIFATTLTIPRNSKTQTLIFATDFNNMGQPKEIGGLDNLGYHVSDGRLLAPLGQWVKANTENHSQSSAKDASGNNCSATSHFADVGASPTQAPSAPSQPN